MGKGYNNFMSKKFFHPGSHENLKRVWMAEQKTRAEEKKQEELRIQYEKEQDLYHNKQLLCKDNKDKLTLNFMYDPPPGMVKEENKDGLEIEETVKFEWQRKFNAPREDYCKDNTEIRDQPFGIRVRNVRCIKCHTWGHINTDKECPLFNRNIDDVNASSTVRMDPDILIKNMNEDGLKMKKNISAEQKQHKKVLNMFGKYDWMNGYAKEVEFLKTLKVTHQIKLLKKLKKLVKRNNKGADLKEKLKNVLK